MSSQVELRGEISNITFRNEETGYTIAKLTVASENISPGKSGLLIPKLITVVGNLISITPGENLAVKGEWHKHPKFGEQFKIVSYEALVPATIKGIEKYLGSGLIKGIGPVMAKRLVAKFGLDTLDIIENDIKWLKEVEGFGHKRIEEVKKAWGEQKEIRNVMVFLQGHGISPAYAAKIYKQYGNSAIRIVKENPYRLSIDIYGIGFLMADKIAISLGITKNSPKRADAGILHTMNKLAETGHVYYPLVIKSLGQLTLDKRIVIEDITRGAELEENNKAVYLSSLHFSETGIANKLRHLNSSEIKLAPDIDKAIEKAQSELKIQLAVSQKEAVKQAVLKKVMVITGGPGTGKTTIVNSICKIYGYMGKSVLLAAPTGRAAKRMSEATGHEAKTMHRLLAFSPKTGKFARNEDTPLKADLIILDESSMIDTVLMYHFLKAVPKGASLVLVGDIDQLPSVGTGNVLKDIISSNVLTTVRLTEIFRQAKESMIIVNAHRINAGQMPVFTPVGQKGDCRFMEIEDPQKVLEAIVDLCRNKIPGEFGYNPFTDIQVLTPMHKGIIGTQNLNIELQKHLNPSTDELKWGEKVLKFNDKVMQIKNNYDKDIFNGDVGRITRIDREEHEVSVDFNGRIVGYAYTELDEIVPAYAVSVHKAQGSEYPVVVIPIITQHYIMLQRNLLYTAITRGKSLVIVLGTKRAVGMAVSNNKPNNRYTTLEDRLMQRIVLPDLRFMPSPSAFKLRP